MKSPTVRIHGAALLVGAATFATAATSAADDRECREHQIMPVERQLRRLSLALRGRIPDYEEYAQVAGQREIPEGVIDGYLASDEYRIQVRRFHEHLLWPNPAGAEILSPRVHLVQNGHGAHYAFDRRGEYRGGNGLHSCQDVPQASAGYDATGLPSCVASGQDNVGAFCEEGYELVAPFWAPGAPIKVCAFDAQSRPTWTSTGGTVPCDYGNLDGNYRGCGCGPNLKHCFADYRPDMTFSEELWSEMREQLLLTVDDHTAEGAPYSQLLTTRDEYVNGAIEVFRKNLAANVGYGITYNAPGGGDAPVVGEPNWLDRSWRKVTREAPHAGVLTSLAFSLRFQTNRGRANRFRTAFMGQYFVPPSIYSADDCSATAADLTQRCVCKSCHETLEPMAAHFGAIAERGSASLRDFFKVCPSIQACRDQLGLGTSTGLVNRFYVRDYDSSPITYRLAPLEFIEEHPGYGDHFDAGPAALVAEALRPIEGKDHSLFARSISEKLFKFFIKREPNLDPAAPDNEIATIEALAAALTHDDDFNGVVRAILRLEAFRRMP
jgi:hypothetical protein